MAKAIVLFGVLVACANCHGDKPRSTTSPALAATPVAPPVVLDPHVPLRVTDLGPPVRSARTWTSALVPNARGGWNFITQSWELGSEKPPEYVVIDLDSGTYSLSDADGDGYAVNTFKVRTQLRAPNGRVFIPLLDVGLAYYEPSDETVRDVPPILPSGGPDKIIYSAVFGPDGMLYAGTQSSGLPTIIQIDPNTLTSRVLGHVGRDRKTYSYAYQLAVDPPWVYATVGEMPWELAALNIKTGESKILATRADNRPWMSLETRVDGVRAQLITGVHTPQVSSDYFWCVDGKTVPATAGGKVPFKARKLVPPATPLPGAPEVDLSQLNPDDRGVGRLRWRPAGATDWKVAEYRVKYTTPIEIEGLTPLPDGSVLGETKQYHGFFKVNGSSVTFLGGPTPSRSAFAQLDGLLYTTGYPNSVLYAYDPTKPWTGTTPEAAAAAGANPRMLGNFTEAGAKYASFLTAGQNRLYVAGRLERDGFGAAVGYYEPATKKFGGHRDNLADVYPAGLAVVPELGRVVLSERVRHEVQAAEAKLVVYDKDLAEIERLVVKPGLVDTGGIYPTPAKGVIIGVLPDAVYRYDVAAKKLLDWRDIPTKFDTIAQRPADGSLWGVQGSSLVRIDPVTLEMQTFGEPATVPWGVELLVWQGDDLYAAARAELYRIERVGLP